MAFTPVASTVQVELFQMLHGQRIENVQYWRHTAPYGSAEVVELYNALLTWWTTQFAPLVSANLSLTGMKITDQSAETGSVFEFTAPTPNPAGGDGAPALPGNVALTVSFRTALRGRSYRGRNYVAGLSEDKVSGNTVAAGTVSGLQAAYNALIGLSSALPWEWVVVSRFHDGDRRITGVATPVTSAAVVDPYIDSQRRRLTGRGL